MSAANVQSLTAISDFRAALCTFVVEGRQALAALEMEARRAVEYITHDQAQHWNGEVRRGRELVQQRKLDIHNTRTFKRVGHYIPSCIDEKKELEKAQRRLHLAEAKLEAVRQWGRIAEQAFREFQARLSQFTSILDGELPKASASLERMLASLQGYLAVQAPAAARVPEDTSASEAQSMGATGEERDSAGETDKPTGGVEGGSPADSAAPAFLDTEAQPFDAAVFHPKDQR